MKSAVLLLNFGGPEAPDEVEPFLFELFSDPDVIHLPFGPGFQRWLAGRTSRRRAPVVKKDYERIGGSPLRSMTFAQADALDAELAIRLGEERPAIHCGMAYTAPFVPEAVDAALAGGAERIVALPLFPQYSLTTTGSVHNRTARALKARLGSRRLPLSFVPAFYDHPGYVRAVCDRMLQALPPLSAALPAAEASAGAARPPLHIVFSAHGLPSRYIRQGDPYMRQVQDSVRRIMAALSDSEDGTEQRLGAAAWSLAWQSKVGPLEWLEPATDEVLAELGRKGARILVVPISFVGDHIETLFEIDQTYRQMALEAGAAAFSTSRGLDLHPAFIGCLADVVQRALAGTYDALCFRCLIPRDRRLLGTASCLDCGVKRPYYERLWRSWQDLDRGL